ncbi:hypothetical protein V7124_10720 [Neobacillus niacini]
MVKKFKLLLLLLVCIILLTPSLTNAKVIHEVKNGDSLSKKCTMLEGAIS